MISRVLLKSEEESRSKLNALLKKSKRYNPGYFTPIEKGNYKVVFVIIMHKDSKLKSDNLPLF